MPNDSPSPSANEFQRTPPQYALRGPHRDLVRVTGTDDPRYVLVDHGDGVPALTLTADVELLAEGIDGREAVRQHLVAIGMLRALTST